MKGIYPMLTLSLLASAGCNKPPKAGPAGEANQGTVMVPDTSERERKATGTDGMGMMLMMRSHIDSMAKMSPEQMTRMMARHERMMSQMMDQMRGEMRQMQMPDRREWSGLADSVRQDLAELPGLTGQALSTRMQAHAQRVRRLIAMHKLMIGGM